jgi:hypothetical protein
MGGIINYLTNNEIKSDSKNESNSNLQNERKSIFKDQKFYLQMLLGICGAALIPLLLYLTSSKLFENCDNFFAYFVFSGYCLIGAIFSRAMLKSLAKRLDLEKFQEDLKKQDEKINEVKGEVQQAEKFIKSQLNEEEEPQQLVGNVDTNIEDIKENISGKLLDAELPDIDTYMNDYADSDMKAILHDLQSSKYKDRSIQGLSKKTDIPEVRVKIILNAFKKGGIVDEVRWYGKTFYTLTLKGKSAVFKK